MIEMSRGDRNSELLDEWEKELIEFSASIDSSSDLDRNKHTNGEDKGGPERLTELSGAAAVTATVDVSFEPAEGDRKEATTGVPAEDVPLAGKGFGKSEYRFIGGDQAVVDLIAKLSGRTDEELLEELRGHTTSRDSATGKYPPYDEVRPRVIAISMLLNERNARPPRFRPYRPMPRVAKGSSWGATASLVSNDRQVLDLHWLACTCHNICPSGKWQEMFAETGLNYDLASEFVATVGSTATKIKVLGLHEGEMRQLAVLQTEALQKRWTQLKSKVDTDARPRLRAWLEKQGARTSESIDELLDHYLVLGLVSDSPTDAARLASRVTGTTVDAKKVKRRFEMFKSLKLLRQL
ncbi:hypothetical protein [Nitrogeniibacter aestuarii]|uniref:hypothetical protein n=1 Tax=Nitrogeniibacter aestuarii TaxID=2815343 RepID=UPI001D12B2E5|nr:hypothetical protein [Nitrogeniibacter aestuarii]